MARVVLSIAGLLLAPGALAAEAAAPTTISLTSAEIFAFADRARDAADFATAETAYRSLATNPDIELRTEARFRLALMLADGQHKYREAAVELRKILDEKPKAARVRLELARMQALLATSARPGANWPRRKRCAARIGNRHRRPGLGR